MKVFITKYALTIGIREVEASICNASQRMIEVDSSEFPFSTYYHGNDWHETRVEAIKHADGMRRKKIVSLEKQIQKLKKMSFA